MNSNLWAGAAQIDITPPLGTIVNGEFVAYYAHSINDPLFAKALVLRQGTDYLVMVMVDICGMDALFLDPVKAALSQKTGIPSSNMLIAATHTHYAGSVIDLLGGPCDLEYRNRLGNWLVEAVLAALAKLEPAEAGFTSVNVPEHVLCRRYLMKSSFTARNPVTGGLDKVKTNPVGAAHLIDGPAAQTDPELSGLFVRSLKGRWIGMLGNYSMHYVGDCRNGTITADYFGAFARAMNELLQDADCVSMLSNGTSGDANIWDYIHPERYPAGDHQKSAYIGKDLATRLFHTIPGITWQTQGAISVQTVRLEAARRVITSEALEAAKKIVSETDYRLLIPDSAAMPSIYAREQVLLHARPEKVPVYLQMVQIGGIRIGAIGAEVFSETGLHLKSAAKTPYFTITMANDLVGYIPPQHEFSLGGYETWTCRSSQLAEDTEGLIRAQMKKMLAQ
ncbi:hypothetical protein DLD77_00695 [Chitinophaga alhagiae]|uniref:Neutral/alkaline non-lysosomal ceramidase N-terminal domain-containing protein n=1 Tax=Chitinophaga alhagiae TaxID=2203219 RepID=A0ABN5LRS0_9BACT|nr:hypothetical protein [Chitinophaga alhagiae]AWO00328.1 hypothetical protein DLD77_00695 [Chitinophaga alhagiae]